MKTSECKECHNQMRRDRHHSSPEARVGKILEQAEQREIAFAVPGLLEEGLNQSGKEKETCPH